MLRMRPLRREGLGAARRPAQQWRWIVLAVILVSWGIRVADFPMVPGGIQHDEVTEVLHAQEVIAGNWKLYFYLGDFKGREPMMAYLQAPLLLLLGDNLWGLRLLSVVAGMLTIALVYVTGRRLFGPAVAIIASATVGFSFWPLVMSRIALRGVLVPPLAALSIYMLWRSYNRRESPFFAFGAGAAAAACAYAYLSGWAVLVIAPVYFLHSAIWNRSLFRERLAAVALWASGAAITITPLLVVMASSQQSRDRVTQLSPLVSQARQGDLAPLLRNVLEVLASFVHGGDQFGLYNIPHQPLLPAALSVLFLAGVATCIGRRRDGRYALLLIWLLVGMAPAALAVGGPNNLRSVVSLPAAYLMVAVGAVALIDLASRTRHRLVPALSTIAVIALVAWSAQSQLVDFYRNWPTDSDTRYFYRTSLAQVGRDIVADARNCVSTPYPHDLSQWVVAFVRGESVSDICWFYGGRALAIPAGSGKARWYVPAAISPDGNLAAAENADLQPLLRDLLATHTTISTGHFEDDGVAYRSYETVDLDGLRRDLLGAQGLLPTPSENGRHSIALEEPIALDGGVSLMKAALVPREPGSTAVELLLFWRVDAPRFRPEPLSIFVQLLDSNGQYVTGDDHLDYATSSWRAGDHWIQHHRLQLPADLPRGDYQLIAGVYDWKTNERWAVAGQRGTGDKAVPVTSIALP